MHVSLFLFFCELNDVLLTLAALSGDYRCAFMW